MANTITKINGVDKKYYNDEIKYYFPRGLVTVYVGANSYETRSVLNFSEPETILFDDLDDNKGAANAEGYVDTLANEGFFFELPTETEVEQSEDVDSINDISRNMMGSLDTLVCQNIKIITLLEDIAE